MVNHMKTIFDAKSVNEGFARMVVMGFMADMNPTMDELQDVKTAVSEAVTNAIIHGYHDEDKQVELSCIRDGQKLTVIVEDYGIGIEDIEQARQPLFTTKPDMERSGMGFSFMETFMDKVEVISKVGEGTRVIMTKYIWAGEDNSYSHETFDDWQSNEDKSVVQNRTHALQNPKEVNSSFVEKIQHTSKSSPKQWT